MISRMMILTLIALSSIDVSAGLVLDRTRVIYPEGSSSVSLLVTNPDSEISIAQSWMDKDNPASTPNEMDVMEIPFYVTPAVARVTPESGQALRVSYVGHDLPKDRESVYYLNVLQIPPQSAISAAENKLTLLMRTRIKLFFRPKALLNKPERVYERIEFEPEVNGVLVKNPTPYYASFSSAKLIIGGAEYSLESEMLAPYSESIWKVSVSNKFPLNGARVEANYLNDYGAVISVGGVLN